MGKKGLLIDYYWCTGCHTCEVACKQEHGHPAGRWGIKVNEIILESAGKVEVTYLPSPTELCDLCAERTGEGALPACVKHCQAACMAYGDLDDLARSMGERGRSVLFTPGMARGAPRG